MFVNKLIPKATSVMHWSHANKIGPWQRLREIADHAYRATLPNKVIPGDVGWPVAPAWTKRWNDNGGVVTSYTSKFDPDGKNV